VVGRPRSSVSQSVRRVSARARVFLQHAVTSHEHMTHLTTLLRDIRACTECARHLPLGPRPVLAAHTRARILVVGQAPWNDPSGERLREWMRIDRQTFYDARQIAIVPMGFCYPGTGTSGDLPPRPECSALWHEKLLSLLPHIQLTLLIGQYAQAYFLKERRGRTLTETVRAWRQYWPTYLPLPHPSPRNNRWLTHNPWFMRQTVPRLHGAVRRILGSPGGRDG
jgi:uracil-DNA glycosylase